MRETRGIKPLNGEATVFHSLSVSIRNDSRIDSDGYRLGGCAVLWLVIFMIYKHTCLSLELFVKYLKALASKILMRAPMLTTYGMLQKSLSLHFIPRVVRICDTGAPAEVCLHVLLNPMLRLDALLLVASVRVY